MPLLLSVLNSLINLVNDQSLWTTQNYTIIGRNLQYIYDLNSPATARPITQNIYFAYGYSCVQSIRKVVCRTAAILAIRRHVSCVRWSNDSLRNALMVVWATIQPISAPSFLWLIVLSIVRRGSFVVGRRLQPPKWNLDTKKQINSQFWIVN